MPDEPTADHHVTILRGRPVDGEAKAGPPYRGRSLASQVAVYMHADADANANGDRFGLMTVYVARGLLILHAILVVPDGLDKATVAQLRRWAKANPVDTAQGRRAWKVVTRSAFFDPKATRERQPCAFVPNAYSSHTDPGPVVGVDLGRVFSLASEHVIARRTASQGAADCWLPGWGTWRPAKADVIPTSPHRPPLRIEHRRVGWSVEFVRCPRGFGKRTKGVFPTLLSLAYALDADRGAGFIEHARNFAMTVDELPVSVTLDADGADRMAAAVASIHALALQLDDEAGRWFTSSTDRREGVHRLPLARVQSPAAIADHLLRQFKVAPPLRQFPLDDAEAAAWWEGFHGGRNDDLPALRGRPFWGVVLDLGSAYPLGAHLVGWWDVQIADRLVRRPVTRSLRALCRRAAADPSVLLDPAVWRRFGLTIVEVACDGEPFPISIDDALRPDGRTETVPVTTRGRTLFYSWLDVVAAAVLSGRVPTIISAVCLVPEGRQGQLRQRVPFLPGLTLDADRDPAVDLVGRRRQAKAEGDATTAALLHAAVNSLVSGKPSELHDVARKVGKTWEPTEHNAPWTFVPLATTVTASARLLLAVLDRMVRDRGGVVTYRDTDSSIIPASPDGGVLILDDGSTFRELSYAEVADIRRAFDRLSPDPDWQVWKMTPGPGEPPMRSIIFGPKRHVEYTGPDEAHVLVDWTETGLGGSWADPPTMPGRCPEGGRAWSKAAVERDVRYAVAKLKDPDRAVREPAPWDVPGALPFPTLRRLAVTTPVLLATLPDALGVRVGGRYVEGMVSEAISQPVSSVVAVDPGGPLDGEPEGQGWESLHWLDRKTGEPVKVTTDPMAYGTGSVVLESLAARAARYGAAPRGENIESVVVTPLSVVYRGRVSPVIDAEEDGVPGDLAGLRVAYEDAHGLGPGQRAALVALAASMPHERFARLVGTTPRVAGRIARGDLPQPAAVRRILTELRRNGGAWIVPEERTCTIHECLHPVTARRIYCVCCPSHAERGRKRHQRAARREGGSRTCPDPRE